MGELVRGWEPDRPLTCETASAIIRSCFPAVESRDLKHLGSGWEFDAFLTADGWVFRFPRRAEAADLFERERRVHELVLGVLPKRIGVPRIELLGPPTLGFPYSFAGHRYIRGIAADALEARLLPVVAADVGVALGAIHSVPESLAEAAGMHAVDPEEPGRSEWVDVGRSAALRLYGFDPIVDLALEWLRDVSFPIAPYPGPPRVIHQDLAPEHLIADSKSGDLAGILDWTDAALGDPARDFVFLITWRGWGFAEEVLSAYPGVVDPSFRDRLGQLSRFLSLMWLGIAHEQGSDLKRHVEGVRHAFSRESSAS